MSVATIFESMDDPPPPKYADAIARLQQMAAELRPQIEAEQDVEKRTRLIKECLTCSDAASFLLNDDGA